MTGIHPHTKPPLLPRRQGKGLDMTASEGLLEAVDEFEHLVTQTDGITVALEDHTVKRVADDKDRQRCVGLQLHGLAQVAAYAAVGIDTEDHGRGKPRDGCLELLLVVGTRRKEQHHLAPPLLQFCRTGGDVAQRVVGGLLPYRQQT